MARLLPDRPVARSGIESAILDACARARGIPLHGLLEPTSQPVPLRTDITIPIGTTARTVELALAHAAAGFDCFKVKVGRDAVHDREALAAIHDAVPDARFRLDANESFDAATALRLLEDLLAAGLHVELFEQPCPRADLSAMAEITAHSSVPIVADESARTLDDVDRIATHATAHAINLKLAKMGGPLASLAIALRARAHGLTLMAGAMVETRLGITTMAHVVTALGGVDWLDLDTPVLLATDPFIGGYASSGPHLKLRTSPGVDVEVR